MPNEQDPAPTALALFSQIGGPTKSFVGPAYICQLPNTKGGNSLFHVMND